MLILLLLSLKNIHLGFKILSEYLKRHLTHFSYQNQWLLVYINHPIENLTKPKKTISTNSMTLENDA